MRQSIVDVGSIAGECELLKLSPYTTGAHRPLVGSSFFPRARPRSGFLCTPPEPFSETHLLGLGQLFAEIFGGFKFQ